MPAEEESQKKSKSPVQSALDLAQTGMNLRGAGAARLGASAALRAAAPAIAAVLFIVIFIVVILVAIGIIGGGGGTAVAAPVGSGLGLKDNYCQAFISPDDFDGDGQHNDCSVELENIILQAASWAKVPAGVLNGIGLSENLGDAMVLSEASVILYSNPDGEIPGCAQSDAGARGPMQFLPSTFERYKTAINIATGQSRTSNICNVADSVYAAAWKIKCDTTPRDHAEECSSGNFSTYDYNDSTQDWEQAEVYEAARHYLGACEDRGVTYCENVYQFYLNKKDETVGDVASPAGRCPVEGTITGRYLEQRSDHRHQGVDIQSDKAIANWANGIRTGDVVRSTISGKLDLIGSDPGGYGNYVDIKGDQYTVRFGHLADSSILVERGTQVSVGQPIATEDHTGTSSAPHVHYEVFDSTGVRISPEPFLPVEVRGGRYPYYCKEGASGVIQ
ncbi:MAG: peptidoglycan DD-metalloendopeptidase family protein [Candidatus Woykebacteria bacterium]